MNSKYPHKEIKRRPRDRFNEATYEIFTIFNFRIYNSYISNSIFLSVIGLEDVELTDLKANQKSTMTKLEPTVDL